MYLVQTKATCYLPVPVQAVTPVAVHAPKSTHQLLPGDILHRETSRSEATFWLLVWPEGKSAIGYTAIVAVSGWVVTRILIPVLLV